MLTLLLFCLCFCIAFQVASVGLVSRAGWVYLQQLLADRDDALMAAFVGFANQVHTYPQFRDGKRLHFSTVLIFF